MIIFFFNKKIMKISNFLNVFIKKKNDAFYLFKHNFKIHQTFFRFSRNSQIIIIIFFNW